MFINIASPYVVVWVVGFGVGIKLYPNIFSKRRKMGFVLGDSATLSGLRV
jgi:hypothetical protein